MGFREVKCMQIIPLPHNDSEIVSERPASQKYQAPKNVIFPYLLKKLD